MCQGNDYDEIQVATSTWDMKNSLFLYPTQNGKLEIVFYCLHLKQDSKEIWRFLTVPSASGSYCKYQLQLSTCQTVKYLDELVKQPVESRFCNYMYFNLAELF